MKTTEALNLALKCMFYLFQQAPQWKPMFLFLYRSFETKYEWREMPNITLNWISKKFSL